MSGYVDLAANLTGTGLSVWTQIYGMQQQRKESRRAEKKTEEFFERGVELEAGERREARMFKREESQAGRAYKSRMTFLDNMLTNLNSNPAASGNLQKLLRGRR